MALQTAQQAKLIGTTVAYTAADVAGDTFRLTDRTVLLVKNASGGSINVTVIVPGNTEFGQAQPDIVVAVAAGAEVAIGPLLSGLVDPAVGVTQGLIKVTYSAVTSVTVALVTV